MTNLGKLMDIVWLEKLDEFHFIVSTDPLGQECNC